MAAAAVAVVARVAVPASPGRPRGGRKYSNIIAITARGSSTSGTAASSGNGRRKQIDDGQQHRPDVDARRAARAARRDLADGAAARAAAVLALYPLDALKARVQVSSARSARAVAAAAAHGVAAAPALPTPAPAGGLRAVLRAAASTGTVYAAAGGGGGGGGGLAKATAPAALSVIFRGAPAALLGLIPYGVLTYFAFETARGALERRAPGMPPRRRVLLGACAADLVGALWLAPAEFLKLQVQAGMYASVPSAIAGTWHAAGPRGFFNGLPAQIFRDMPFRALQIVAYDAAKDWYLRHCKKNNNLLGGLSSPVMTRSDTAIVGAAVGAAVGVVTTPFDLVRTRIMSQRVGPGAQYHDWVCCVTRILKRDGAVGLFRGALPRAVYMAASVAIFTLGYEASKKFMTDKKLLWHADVATVPHRPRTKRGPHRPVLH